MLDGDETERGMLLSAMFRMEIAMMLCRCNGYCTFGLKYGTWWVIQNINDIPMRSKTPSLTEKKLICAWKFVRSSDIIIFY